MSKRRTPGSPGSPGTAGTPGTAPAPARGKAATAAGKPRRKLPRPRGALGQAPRRRAAEVYDRLQQRYPDAKCALEHEDAYQLLVATILSAQCTDERVNKVTPDLFKRYPTPEALAKAEASELEQAIKSTGFFRNKTKSLLGASRKIVDDHGGGVPDTMDELLDLPGVARKTANVVLGNAYGKSEGVTVDTHVTRLSQRLGFTQHTDPVKIEQDLMALYPRERWTMLSHLLIFHGRQICVARRPRCDECPVADLCPKIGVELAPAPAKGGGTRRA